MHEDVIHKREGNSRQQRKSGSYKSLPLPPSFMSGMARGGMVSRNFVWAAHGGILCAQLGLRSHATLQKHSRR
jgi:hypothetical protein